MASNSSSSGRPAIKIYQPTGFFYAFDDKKEPHLIRELTAYVVDPESPSGMREGRKKYVALNGEPVWVEGEQVKFLSSGIVMTKTV